MTSTPPRKPLKKLPRGRSLDQVWRHYCVEREIAARLRRADRVERSRMYHGIYDELFRLVPDHPRLTHQVDPSAVASRNLQKLAWVQPFLDERSVVAEFGPGDCAFARFLCGRVKEVYAIDISCQASTDTAPSNLHMIVYDGYRIERTLPPFTMVFSDQFLEHLHPEDVEGHFALVRRLLQEGGRYVFRAPHRFRGPHDVSKYFSRVPEGFHLSEPTYVEIARVLQRCGYRHWTFHGSRRGRYHALPGAYFDAVERVLAPMPLAVRGVLAAPFLPRQMYGVAVA